MRRLALAGAFVVVFLAGLFAGFILDTPSNVLAQKPGGSIPKRYGKLIAVIRDSMDARHSQMFFESNDGTTYRVSEKDLTALPWDRK